ncbi:phosphoglycolate phosphatase [Robbsia andropogonis]|uniref:phosphoglycolate phosphatase n=1 Tax=Robbsia andropogonis TaxID=28092 RepID=UPI000464D294|nr:phosphoglycolate phosphatase [Robbsia andropogonis]MCP1121162.1 phosphoglycolate phosphatase [Robbsia andropogonis]MCP1130954.1 phosphoglycolate phosphatase [Robbsia andropogonis]
MTDQSSASRDHGARFLDRPVRAAIVDLDGTLADTADDFTAALNIMLRALPTPLEQVTREEVVRYIGKGTEKLIRDVLAARLPEGEARACFDIALTAYHEGYEQINGMYARLYPDVVSGLTALRSLGLALACVTNKPERFARGLLARHDLLSFFPVVIGGDTVARKKPDPLPMLTACEQLATTPTQTVAIGDSENDLHAARAAGISSMTVPYGYNHGKPVQELATDAIVSTLLEAARLLGFASHQVR